MLFSTSLDLLRCRRQSLARLPLFHLGCVERGTAFGSGQPLRRSDAHRRPECAPPALAPRVGFGRASGPTRRPLPIGRFDRDVGSVGAAEHAGERGRGRVVATTPGSLDPRPPHP